MVNGTSLHYHSQPFDNFHVIFSFDEASHFSCDHVGYGDWIALMACKCYHPCVT